MTRDSPRHASTSIADRLARLRTRVDAAIARRGGGPPVRLIAVSKRQPAEAVAAAWAAGQRDFGENYAQEFAHKRQALQGDDIRWHFIGALQSNKVKTVLGSTLLHAVDRPSVLQALQRRAAAAGVVQAVLVQVNLAAEPGKAGIAVAQLPALLDAFAETDAVQCRGLMLIPPLATPEASRPLFAGLRALAREHRARPRRNVAMAELSMGMSADFEVAIAEGATLVRVGTAAFGPRPSGV